MTPNLTVLIINHQIMRIRHILYLLVIDVKKPQFLGFFSVYFSKNQNRSSKQNGFEHFLFSFQ